MLPDSTSFPAQTPQSGVARVGADGRFQHVDASLAQMLGYSTSELMRLRFHDITHPDDLLRDEAQFERVLMQGYGAYSMLKRYITASGDQIWAELSVDYLRARAGGPQYFASRVRKACVDAGILTDLHRRAMRDPLTGLLNRGEFDDQLICAERRTRRTGQPFALLAIDLDGFKLINDSHGHSSGDKLLRAVASRIAGALRPGDLAGRVGGDEFMVILRNITGAQDLLQRRERLAASVARPFVLGFGPVRMSASIGMARCPQDAASVPQLMALADADMYRTKQRRFSA